MSFHQREIESWMTVPKKKGLRAQKYLHDVRLQMFSASDLKHLDLLREIEGHRLRSQIQYAPVC